MARRRLAADPLGGAPVRPARRHAAPGAAVDAHLVAPYPGAAGTLGRRAGALSRARHPCRDAGTSQRLAARTAPRSEEHTSELQSRENLVCRLLLEKKNTITDEKSHDVTHMNSLS